MKEELSRGVHASVACIIFKAVLFLSTMETLSPEDALTKAREVAGGSTALAQRIGISPQAVGQWKIVPPTRVLLIEAATGVSRYVLRPDVFGACEAATPVPPYGAAAPVTETAER